MPQATERTSPLIFLENSDLENLVALLMKHVHHSDQKTEKQKSTNENTDCISVLELSRFRESESLESPLLEKFAGVGVTPSSPESTP